MNLNKLKVALSSNSLIHLTETKQALTGILTENFKIKYCVEDLLTPAGTLSYAVPMVSFCDIPMSEIKEHIFKYGSYGIGLTKEWGQSKSLNPVFYVDKNSSIGRAYNEVFDELFLNQNRRVTNITELEAKHLDIFRYMKNYEADLDRGDEIMHDYRFADEKEWRFVPPREDALMIANKTAYLKDKTISNSKISDLRLNFEPKDIKYIIIKHDNEITEFIDLLKKSKGNKYTYDDVERLMTRIITVEQILTDF